MEEETVETQPNQQVLEQTPVAVEEKKSNIGLLIVVSLIVISLIAGGVYAGMQIGKKQTPLVIPPQTETPTLIPTQVVQPTQVVVPPTSTSNETTDWKTYRNDKYGFEFKYPRDFIIGNEVKERKNRTFDLFELNFQKTDLMQNKTVLVPDGQPEYPYYFFKIGISENINFLSEVVSKDEEVTIGGIKGIRGMEASAPCGPTTVSYVIYDSKFFCIQLTPCSSGENDNKYINIYNQILSTFKFLE